MLFKASGGHEQEENVQLRSEENHTWSVDVEFYPLDEYNTKKKIDIIEQPQALFSQQPNTSNPIGKKKPNYLVIALVAVIVVLICVILAIII